MKESKTGSRKETKIEARAIERGSGIVIIPGDTTGTSSQAGKSSSVLDLVVWSNTQRGTMSTLQSLPGHGKWCWMRRLKKREKEIRYSRPASELERLVQRINLRLMEIGCRGFVATQTRRAT